MKVQGLNNQNNLSHKAYFKQNEAFKFLYKNANKNELFSEIANTCKKNLPNHELEIATDLFVNNEKSGLCRIFNNTTKKTTSTLVSNGSMGLLAILSHILLIEGITDFFVEGEDVKDIDCYDILTTKD